MTFGLQIVRHLKRDPNGLAAVVTQQYNTHEVFVLGWMDKEVLDRTLSPDRVTLQSRSRREY